MIAIRILFSLFCGCFVIVNSQSTVDETSSQCHWNNDEYVLCFIPSSERADLLNSSFVSTNSCFIAMSSC